LYSIYLLFCLKKISNDIEKLLSVCDHSKQIIFKADSMRADGYVLSDVMAQFDKDHKMMGKSTFAMQLRLVSMVYSDPDAKIQTPEEYANRIHAGRVQGILEARQQQKNSK